MGPTLPGSPLRDTSMYGSVGATIPDINPGFSMRSASSPSACNNVTHQVSFFDTHSYASADAASVGIVQRWCVFCFP